MYIYIYTNTHHICKTARLPKRQKAKRDMEKSKRCITTSPSMSLNLYCCETSCMCLCCLMIFIIRKVYIRSADCRTPPAGSNYIIACYTTSYYSIIYHSIVHYIILVVYYSYAMHMITMILTIIIIIIIIEINSNIVNYHMCFISVFVVCQWCFISVAVYFNLCVMCSICLLISTLCLLRRCT